ncbi:MAG: LytTR family transcriptional regulator DNA-binding domain-containing protein [Oscillospiraceae bacterium]|nr:LytTR family transcriptional regulator DNA-binding domain-containing protein [Oscillospiraceae bacterium]
MVIKIAVIVPDEEQNRKIASFIKRNLPSERQTWTMFAYASVNLLIHAMQSEGFRPDIVLLPSGSQGYSLGRHIRSINHRCVLIYMPDKDADFHDAFSSCPIAHFTMWKNEECRRALASAEKYLEDEIWIENEHLDGSGVFIHENQKQMIRMRYTNIDYFESDLHRVIIHRYDGETEAFIGKLNDIQENCTGNFERVHQSYLVNVKHIAKVFRNTRRLLFYSGNEAYCSRAAFPKFLECHPELEVTNDD